MFLRLTPFKASLLLASCLGLHLCWVGFAMGQDGTDDLFSDLENAGNEVSDDLDQPSDLGGAAPTASEEEASQRTPEQVLAQADQLLEAGQFLEAIQAYSAVLSVPQLRNNIAALVGRGKAFAEIENYDLALKSLDRAVNASATPNPFALNERGKVFLEIEKFNEAVLDFGRAVELIPGQTEFLKNYGAALIKQGAKESQLGDLEAAANVPKGIRALSTVVEKLSELMANDDFAEHQEKIAAELSDAYFERGLGQMLVRDMTKAVSDLEFATELAPESFENADQLAAAYFQSAIELALAYPSAPDELISKFTNTIVTLEAMIEKAEALEAEHEEDGPPPAFDFQRIPELYARMASARIELAKYQSDEERDEHYQAALDACVSALARDDQFADAYLLQGTAQRHLLQYDEAIKSFAECIRLSGSGEARFRRGIVYYYQDEMGLALRDFSNVRSPRTGQRDSRALFWSGIVHMTNEDYVGAVRLFSDSINANSTYVLAYSNRGAAYLRLGNYERAIKDFNEVIRRTPNSNKGRELREFAYRMRDTEDES